ncbi:MAG TPA: SCO family protein [Candidatus Binataceae bacterium]|nr:SCO family protein [Candidatus Binataceae bacterium]
MAKALVAVAMLGVWGCSHGKMAKAGSYPAANPADCLPPITLVDQHGRNVDLASLKGRPVLIDFIYTSCPGPCPLMTARMVSVAKLVGPKLGKQVTFVSITIDPERDHPSQLERYAVARGADHPGWLFLTGTPAQIDRVLALFDLTSDRNPDGTVNHAVASFLLGPDGHQVRQYQPLEVKPATVAADIDRVLG